MDWKNICSFLLIIGLFIGTSISITDSKSIESQKDWETLQELKEEEINEKSSLNTRSPNLVCPGGGSCSGHGSCNSQTGVCTCNTGYAGDDCSYSITAIQSGVIKYNQQVGSRQWTFYTIQTSSGNGLLVQLNQTNNGDADLYLLQNGIPTRSNYAYREITTNPNPSISVPNAGAAVWYIGVYGYLTTTFSISASTTSQCPQQNNCNAPNGVCVSPGVCQCNTGFSGSDCSIGTQTLTLGVTYTGSIQQTGWNMYQVNVPQTNVLLISINELNAAGDVDIYAKFNAVPTLYSYDYRDLGVQNTFNLSISQPSAGTWYIGCYGYQAVQYQITVYVISQCPNQCSLHGTCVGSACSCNSGYSGTYCQTMTGALTAGIPVTGFVSSNSWNYYHATPNSANNMVVSVNTTSFAGDCDLYVKNGQTPSQFSFDYRDIGLLKNFKLTVPTPGSATWYIGVYGYSNCQYNVMYTVSNTCPGNPPCSNNGQCNAAGVCICNPGFGGDDCSSTNSGLTPGQTVTGAVNISQWNYMQITVTNSDYLTISLKETSTTGFIWLYVSKDSTPDTRNYDFSDQETNTGFHSVHYNNPTDGIYYIGVYGNPFAQGSVSYSLAAWFSYSD